jgi:hypothetical protein
MENTGPLSMFSKHSEFASPTGGAMKGYAGMIPLSEDGGDDEVNRSMMSKSKFHLAMGRPSTGQVGSGGGIRAALGEYDQQMRSDADNRQYSLETK